MHVYEMFIGCILLETAINRHHYRIKHKV